MTNPKEFSEKEEIDFPKIERKWQTAWAKNKIFEADDNKKKKYYVLEMFPYPSGSGLHMGHAFNYSIGDIFARFKLMNGYNVLHPMGYDALGLPAENAAIKEGVHPQDYTDKSIKNFIRQQKELGLSYDWTRVINTSSKDYYKWDQWIFLKLFEKGLAYKKKSSVNWCPKCNTVLANEQVHNGKCWRHEDTNVEIKHLNQWYFKTTHYAEELYDNIDSLNWPQRTKAMQKHWIGKSHGTQINFEINGKTWKIFTTRPDTIYGVTFLVISAQHTDLFDIVTKEQEPKVKQFLKKLKSVSEKELEGLEKEGIFTGSYAIHPITKEKVPVYAGNFVVADYGSGMVMAVPAHDKRDFLFAKKYEIPIKIVIQPQNKKINVDSMNEAYTKQGILVNSEKFNGLKNTDAKEKITDFLIKNKLGKRTTNFKLRDWLISRQRYWGTPIPIIYCDKCGTVPVSEKDLPVVLPKDVTFGKGNPLETSKSFNDVKCPICNSKARRETDTMDTFVNSSWYYLRYCDPKNSVEIFDKKKANDWCPIDMYVGGAEHACMHLVYIRFYTKFLRDLGLLNFDEPANELFHQGMLHGEDGDKMSKSKGNVILPEVVSKKYGIDAARFFLMSIASPSKDLSWSAQGIEGTSRFLNRVIYYFKDYKSKISNKSSVKIESKLNRTIKGISEDIESLRYNFATIKLRELFESIEREKLLTKDVLESFLKMLNPFCPHITEELWEGLGNKPFISNSSWPKYDESKVNQEAEFEDEIVNNMKLDIQTVLKLANIKSPKKIELIISYKWKYDFFNKFKEEIKKTRNPKELIPIFMNSDLKKNGKQIMKLLPNLLKDASKIPEVILGQSKEFDIVKASLPQLKKEFNTQIDVVIADDSKHAKANNAIPGKPAILVE